MGYIPIIVYTLDVLILNRYEDIIATNKIFSISSVYVI